LHLNNDTGENATFFKDFSGNGNNGTAVGGGVINSSGKLNGGANIDRKLVECEIQKGKGIIVYPNKPLIGDYILT